MAHIVHGTLVPDVATTVTLDAPYAEVDVLNRNGAGEIYFRADGETPVVEGDDNQVVPAAVGASAQVSAVTSHNTEVSLISDQACTFTVSGV